MRWDFSLSNGLFTLLVIWISAWGSIRIVKSHMDLAFANWAKNYPGVGQSFLDDAFNRLEGRLDRIEERYREHCNGHP